MSDSQRRLARLVEGRDYRVDAQGRVVFTAAYLRDRGACCGAKCRNCPFGWENVMPCDRIAGELQPPLDEPASVHHRRKE